MLLAITSIPTYLQYCGASYSFAVGTYLKN